MSKTIAFMAASRFHELAIVAARNGGFWMSAAGGTANVIAGEISKAANVSFEVAHMAIEMTASSEGWYAALAAMQPFDVDVIPYDDVLGEWVCRWDVRTIARAACRSALRH